MYALLHELFSDRKGGEVFTCFGFWHWIYILLTLCSAGLAFCRLRRLDAPAKERALNRWIGLAFGLYMADFFLMPFAYEIIDIEKLPFHVCTAMCVACFLSRHWKLLSPWRSSLALLGFLSNLVYLLYPAGVMWHQAHPLSYRVIQTLSFHGIMAVYGFLELCFGLQTPGIRNWRRDLTVITAMTAWAMLGNALYNGEAGGYCHFFNWFFVVRDPFSILPAHIAPWVMPFVNIGVFFLTELIICGLFFRVRNNKSEKRKHTK